jgi:hypothetical protein
MFRVLVLILMLPPMLMPPGMCICQFAPLGKASDAPLSASPGRPHAVGNSTDPRPDCTCDSCRRARTTAAVPEGRDDQPAGGPSAPGPGKHWPGCPAATGDAPLTTAIPTLTVQVDLSPAADTCIPVVIAVVQSGRAAPVPSPVISPPLFITHCTLLI